MLIADKVSCLSGCISPDRESFLHRNAVYLSLIADGRPLSADSEFFDGSDSVVKSSLGVREFFFCNSGLI